MAARDRPGDIAASFGDAVLDSQSVFRTLLSATAYPGRVQRLDRVVPAPRPLGLTTTALCLSLMDFETPVWLDCAASTAGVLAHLRFHCSAPIVADSARAQFAVVVAPDQMPRLKDFDCGTDEYPDRAATLIVQTPSVSSGPTTSWHGPGIPHRTEVGIAGLPVWFWQDRALLHEIYPRGIDLFFTCGDAVVGLPRTIRVEA